MQRWGKGVAVGAAVLALASCAETDNAASSHLQQLPTVDAQGNPIIEAGDIAIAGQMVAHSIMALPEVAGASKPPLVQFAGVTSVVNGPVDTTPYTELLRDRLLLITREKLRFVERELPPLGSHKKGHKDSGSIDVDTDADYQILAELRGNFDDDHYHVQIQFVEIGSKQILFNGVYRISKEAQATPVITTQGGDIESTAPNPPMPPPTNGSSLQ